jgi:type I restriction enzyme S subunit
MTLKSASPAVLQILDEAGLGELPADWEIVRIEALLSEDRGISVGVMYPGDHDPAGIPLIKAGDLAGSRINPRPVFRITPEKHHEYRRTQLEGDELLISLVGDVGRCAIVPPVMAGWNAARAIAVLRFVDPTDAAFVRICLMSAPLQHLMQAWATTTVQATLNLKEIRQLPLPWPPKEQRKAVAHILCTLDDKIELNRGMNETLEAMARALFKSWFVDFDPVHAKAQGRNPGLPPHIAALFPDSFEDSELGEIPAGWGVECLGDALVELETGGRPKGGISGYASGVPSIGAESIVGLGVFDYSKTRYVPRHFFDGMTRGHVQNRDVLLYKDGGRPGEFEPHLTLVGDGFPFNACAINEHVYRMQAKKEVGQNLLFFWLSSDFAMDEMRIKGTGVAIPGLNSTQVRSLTMLVPPSGIARAFDAILEPWIARLLAACNESRTLAALRDALLPKLISGEIRVKDVEKILEALT